jgi:predicted ribosomally synthesized peptide with SipW-like signal peptide
MSDRHQIVNAMDHRTRDYRKVALSIALLLAAAAALIGGAFATFTDTVTAGPQTISSGTVKIAVGPANDAATGATNIAAGDTIAREADLNSTGATLANKEITLKFTASTTSKLDTDPTNGLQVSIKACTVAWTRKVEAPPPAFKYTCGGAESTVKIGGAETASVSALETTPGALTPLNSLATGGQDYLVFTLTLPEGAPGDLSKIAACTGPVSGTVTTEDLQGCSSTLTYNFQATQRNAIAQ